MQMFARVVIFAVLVVFAILAPIGRRFVNDPMLFVLGGGVIFLTTYLLG